MNFSIRIFFFMQLINGVLSTEPKIIFRTFCVLFSSNCPFQGILITKAKIKHLAKYGYLVSPLSHSSNFICIQIAIHG